MVDGKIARLSVSQLSRFDTREKGGCQRKWWYKYIGRIPDPLGPGQQFGIDGHKRFEDYYNGQPVVWLDCDIPALSELPKPGPDVRPEVALERLTCLRIPFQGSMDLVVGNEVYDYKYQSKIRVYSEPTAQLWGYLEELRLRNDSSGRLSFSHVYISKSAPYRAKKVTQSFEPREVERNWATYGSLIKEMVDVAAEKDVDKVEANKSACYAYGPCPYLGICNRNPVVEEEFMGFFEDLEKAKLEQAMGQAVVKLPEIKALPPDAPPPDAVPTAPTPPVAAIPAPTPKKRGRPKKLTLTDVPANDNAVNPGALTASSAANPEPTPPDEHRARAYPPPPILDTRIKTLRLGLKVGMPDYGSVNAEVEVEGTDEEKMHAQGMEIVMRRLEKLLPAYKKAMELKKAG
jgi:hypothetical protein